MNEHHSASTWATLSAVFFGFILAFAADFFFCVAVLLATLFNLLFCFVFFRLLCIIHLLTNSLCTPPFSPHALLQCNTFKFDWWRSIQYIRPSATAPLTCATSSDECTASSSRNANHSVFFNYTKSPQSYSANELNLNRPMDSLHLASVGWDVLPLPRCLCICFGSPELNLT